VPVVTTPSHCAQIKGLGLEGAPVADSSSPSAAAGGGGGGDGAGGDGGKGDGSLHASLLGEAQPSSSSSSDGRKGPTPRRTSLDSGEESIIAVGGDAVR
jgi:hypothetical protein